jgi:hypothetical protein
MMFVTLGLSALSCTSARDVDDVAGPNAAVTTDPHVDHVDLIPDVAPGTLVARNACLSFHAKAYDRSNPQLYLPNEPITWTSYTGGILVFDEANVQSPRTVTRLSSAAVLVCGIGDGFGSFNASSSDGVPSKMWELDIGSPLTSLTISGPSTLHDNSGPALVYASATDVQGTVKDRTLRAAWSSNAATIVSVSQTNSQEWLTQHKVGTAVITASLYGKSAQLTVTVLGVNYVTVDPPSAMVRLGQTRQLTATAHDINGGAFVGKTVSWTSSNTAVATVAPTGVVTPVQVGQATISATVDEKTGTAAITVGERLLVAGEVDGPRWINQDGYYSWNSSASGGTAPYTYRWEINFDRYSSWGFIGGNSNTVSFGVSPDDGSFQLRLTITSNDGQTAVGGAYVNVSGGTGCETQIICSP